MTVYYRHVKFGENFHGSKFMRKLRLLCEYNKTKITEAEEAALHTI
jgi:hypothetical protein